ncbi:hypothetical protein ACP70R_026824 [Stipagrostis hirtigluma subsp. patula]
MASPSGSGNDQDDHTQESAHGQREESTAAAAEPPPAAPPVERLQERGDEGPGGGEDADAAAADRKGKGSVLSSPSTSPPGSSSSTSLADYVYGGAEGSSSSAAVVDSSARARVSWRGPVAEGTALVPKVARPVDLKALFVSEQEGIWDLEEQHAKLPTRWIGKRKSLWREVKGGMKHMLLDRIKRRLGYSSRSTTSGGHHVHHQTIPMTGIIQHYQLLEKVTARGEIFRSNALLLRCPYSEFRPVHGDGECFYRIFRFSYLTIPMTGIIEHYQLLEKVKGQGEVVHSNALFLRRAYFSPVHGDGECLGRSFIFSYLEQVLDWLETHGHRILAAVKRVAKQCADLRCTSRFSRSNKVLVFLTVSFFLPTVAHGSMPDMPEGRHSDILGDIQQQVWRLALQWLDEDEEHLLHQILQHILRQVQQWLPLLPAVLLAVLVASALARRLPPPPPMPLPPPSPPALWISQLFTSPTVYIALLIAVLAILAVLGIRMLRHA